MWESDFFFFLQSCDVRARCVCSSQRTQMLISLPFRRDVCGNLCEGVILLELTFWSMIDCFIYNSDRFFSPLAQLFVWK